MTMRGFTRKRGSTWTAYFETKHPATGKRRQQSKGGFLTQKAAEGYLNGVVGRVHEGNWCPASKKTVSDLLDDWLAAQENAGRSPGTLAMYRNTANGWIRPHIGAVRVQELSPRVAQKLVETLRSEHGSRLGRGPLSPRSIQHAVTTLKSATKWATTAQELPRDPLAGFQRPSSGMPGTATSAWTADEARTFLRSVADDRLRAAWWLLLTRGLRREELLGLRWLDVDLATGRAQIVRTRVQVGNTVVEGQPKTDHSRRAVHLDEQLVAELRGHHARQLKERLAAGPAWNDTGHLFVDPLGCPLSPRAFSLRFGRLIKLAGLRRIRLHDGRHTAATMLLGMGVPVHEVSAMLGHSKSSVTLDVYAHAIPGVGAEAGTRLTALLANDA